MGEPLTTIKGGIVRLDAGGASREALASLGEEARRAAKRATTKEAEVSSLRAKLASREFAERAKPEAKARAVAQLAEAEAELGAMLESARALEAALRGAGPGT